MGLRYIGSKARVADLIVELAGPPRGTFVDAMAGTGTVAGAAARAGWAVRVNDSLYGSSCLAAARVLARGDVPFPALGGYAGAHRLLEAAPPVRGTLHREYSPASAALVGHERRYFTEANAAAIDGFRRRVADWSAAGLLGAHEERLLLADLIEAANGVANTAGTYGCYLRDWSPIAVVPVALRARSLLEARVPVEVHTADVAAVPIDAGDTVYLDPPYTKRQYAAYYHLQETLAHGDAPEVGGVTGLRPWRHLASDFCYRPRALGAIVRIVRACPARRVLLSYSDEGHVARADLERMLGPLGDLRVHDLGEIARYRPNRPAHAKHPSVRELVFDLRRPLVREAPHGPAGQVVAA
jgi:adenine-specific DNA-methyltransferase